MQVHLGCPHRQLDIEDALRPQVYLLPTLGVCIASLPDAGIGLDEVLVPRDEFLQMDAANFLLALNDELYFQPLMTSRTSCITHPTPLPY